MPDTGVMQKDLLRVRDLHAWYGESHILHGIAFGVGEGEVVTLLGRNGAGKTTTLRAIMGIVGQRRGSVAFDGKELVGRPSNRIAKTGIAYCPEERGIFASLSVEENLLLPPVVHAGGMSTGEIYALFPNLEERKRSQGTKLSGGEQQMLAIGRILRTGARLLLLDEPTEGLAPVIVQQIGAVIGTLKQKGFTILLVEQNFHFAATLADRHYIVERRTGSVKFGGRETIREPSNAIARQGIAYCPEERGIFSSLNVEENMLLPPQVKAGGMSLDEIYQLFPNLKERRRSQGTKLSGGEQQMLAIGRILRTGATMLLLDEPTEGLAPVIVQRIGEVIHTLKSRGFTILLVEQNFRFAATVADRHYVMEDGRVVDTMAAADVQANVGKLQAYLGV